MQKIYFLLIIFSGLTTSNAQIVSFSDIDLKTRVLESSAGNTIAKDINGNYFAVDSNSDGEIQESEATQVSYLYAKQPIFRILAAFLIFPIFMNWTAH